jgi:hypothetical protein
MLRGMWLLLHIGRWGWMRGGLRGICECVFLGFLVLFLQFLARGLFYLLHLCPFSRRFLSFFHLYTHFHLDRLRPGIQPKLESLLTLYEGKKIIVGRDKLDIVKGVLQKVGCFVFPFPFAMILTFFLSSSPSSLSLSQTLPPARKLTSPPLVNSPQLRAFEKLLQDYPEWIGNVVLIQVTSPALTDSPKLERQIGELVALINGEYGSLDFIPVHH